LLFQFLFKIISGIFDLSLHGPSMQKHGFCKSLRIPKSKKTGICVSSEKSAILPVFGSIGESEGKVISGDGIVEGEVVDFDDDTFGFKDGLLHENTKDKRKTNKN
jgi:hypothetical protein